MQKVIERRERTALTLKYPYFDAIEGWGHPIPEDDPWIASQERGGNYSFLAGFADQGLLYYWVKYNQQSVSIIMQNGDVQN